MHVMSKPIYIFLLFSQKIGFDVSYKLSPKVVGIGVTSRLNIT